MASAHGESIYLCTTASFSCSEPGAVVFQTIDNLLWVVPASGLGGQGSDVSLYVILLKD